jgi:hypothetical protein
MLMPDCSCEELISLSELAELVFGNARRTDLAAQRCHQNRVNLATRYRGSQPVHFVAAADVPAFLGGGHPVLRGSNGWRLELHQLRRRNTRALKLRAAHNSSEARLRLHLERVEREVDEELARSGGATWRSARRRR